jgi:hypothetical protein
MKLAATLLALALIAVIAPVNLGASRLGEQKDAIAAGDAAAIAQFEAAIADYMALRQRLRDEIAGPVAGSTATQLTQASDSLAAAIQRARSGARPGSIFVVPVAVVVKRRVDDAIRHDNLGPVLANIDDEPVTVRAPAIHLRFPAASQMATMPPSLLAALPQLPKELEYRIVGDSLVLRDVDAALIIDFISAAVPRRQ